MPDEDILNDSEACGRPRRCSLAGVLGAAENNLKDVVAVRSRFRSHASAPGAATAGESEEITGFLEVCESDSAKAEAAVALATAGVSGGIIGLLEVPESDSPSLPNSLHPSNSCLGSSTSVCAHLSHPSCALPLLVFALLRHLLRSLLLLHMRMRRSCTMLAIQVVLVASCLSDVHQLLPG